MIKDTLQPPDRGLEPCSAHAQPSLFDQLMDMAVARRRPEVGLVDHTDHGRRYTALTFGHQLREARHRAIHGPSQDLI